jgi:hypothetical protein
MPMRQARTPGGHATAATRTAALTSGLVRRGPHWGNAVACYGPKQGARNKKEGPNDGPSLLWKC